MRYAQKRLLTRFTKKAQHFFKLFADTGHHQIGNNQKVGAFTYGR